ncbi:hypothetical protein K7432_013816 [Basidiobolus ranarum]|uniref:Uncharacterized protein n=1 Tax=Basidiobolus ranarum TaxID=34480 RepID=A0ABR2VRB8_9FUNG
MNRLIKQQRSIYERLGNSDEYRNLEGILNQLRNSVTQVIREQRVLVRGSGDKIPAGLERVIEYLADQSTRIYKVIEKISDEQEQILNNGRGEARDIQDINGKLSKLNNVLVLLTRQQGRILGGDFNLKLKDYSGDIANLGGQLANLKSTMNVLIRQQRSILANHEGRDDRDNSQIEKQLEQLYAVVAQLVQDQERLISIKSDGQRNYGLDRSIQNMNERLGKLSIVIDRLVYQQNEVLSYLGKGDSENNGVVDRKLDLIDSKLGQLREIATLISRQQNVLLHIPEYFSLIVSQSKDLKKLGMQMGQIQSSINDLVELEKSQRYRNNQGQNGNFMKAHIDQLAGLYNAVQRLTSGQDQLFAYVKSNISRKRLNDIGNMTQKLYLLNQATQQVIEEERALLSNVNAHSKNTEMEARQIKVKVDKLNGAVEELTRYQDGLLRAVNSLWKSQDSNFKLVNQKLSTLGSDVSKLINQQQRLFNSKLYNKESPINGRLYELERAVNQLINEQRKLILAKSGHDTSAELREEITAIESGLNQLALFIRELLSKQDQVLQYAGKGNNQGEIKHYNALFEQLFITVNKLIQSQAVLITRDEVVRFFNQQNTGIQHLSLEVGQLSNRIDQILKQQELLNRRGSNGNRANDARLITVLKDISRNARQILEQQNMLARNIRGNYSSQDVDKQIESLRRELSQLGSLVGQIYLGQEKIIQLNSNSEKKYSDEIYAQIEKLTSELIDLDKGINRTSNVQLEILKRIGALSNQQFQSFKNINFKVSTLGERVQQLVNGQRALMGKEDQNTDTLDKAVNELGELRDIVFRLVNQQATILKAQWGGSSNQRIPFDVSVINTKITKLSDVVDQLLYQQQSILNRKDESGLTEEVKGSLEQLTNSIGQLGRYIRDLYAEQTRILQTHTELLRQNLRKTDQVDNQLMSLTKKVDDIVRIQAILLRRVQKNSYDDDRERKSNDYAIIEKLSGLQSFINQIVVQQERLFKAKLNGRVPKEIHDELRNLDSRFGELVHSVDQFAAKQMTVVSKDSDRKLSESLVSEISNLSEQLNGLGNFVKETFNVQSRVLNNNQVIKLLQVQANQIDNLDAKLNELNSRFSNIVEQQSAIIQKIDDSNQGSEESARQNMRPIYEELQALRSVVSQVIDYQRKLGNARASPYVSREALALIEQLNARFSALDNQIASLAQGQNNLLKLEKHDEQHLFNIDKYISEIVNEFRPLKNSVNQILSEQSNLLRREDVIKILQHQTEDIGKVNNRLGKLGSQMTKLIRIQTEILRASGSNQEANNPGIEVLIRRFTELNNNVNSIIDRQNELTKPQVMSQIPQQVVDEIQVLSKQMFELHEQVTMLGNQQQVIIQNENRIGITESKVQAGYEVNRRDVKLLNEQIVKLGEFIGEILTRQDKVANNDRVLDAIKKQNMQIRSLGLGVNDLRRELGALINRQQILLKNTTGSSQQSHRDIQSVLEELHRLDDKVGHLFEQQKVLVNKEVYAAIPREVASQIDGISSQLGELRQTVIEVSREQALFIQRGAKDANNENSIVNEELSKLNRRFNELTKIIARIADGQSRITTNRKVVQILEQHSREIQQIDNRLAQIGGLVNSILSNQFKLIQTSDYMKNAANKGVNLQPIVANLKELQDEVKYLIEQQRKLNRPNVGNSLPTIVAGKVNEINMNLSGLDTRIRQLFERQTELIKSSNDEQASEYRNAIDAINQNLNEFGGVIRQLVNQQKQILRNEDVLKVIAGELGDLKEVKTTVQNFGNQIRNLVGQQKAILNNIWKLNQQKETDLNQTLLGKLALLGRAVNEVVEKQSVLLNREVVTTVPKEIIEEINILNQKFNSMTNSLNAITELQKRLLQTAESPRNRYDEGSEIVGYLNNLRQRFESLYQEVASVSNYQRELMDRKELSEILKRHSRDIQTVGRRVQVVDEKIQCLIIQQKRLYDLIEKP